MTVKKRDGSFVLFKVDKIIDAIEKAFIEVDGEVYEHDTAADIAYEIGREAMVRKEPMSVEEIQDLVEDYLMRSERRDVARAYIRYRYKKEVARNQSTEFIKAIREKLEGKDIQNQNANVDERSFGGRQGEASSLVNKKLALDYLVSEKARKNHLENRIYIHDLDAYYVGMHNCLSIPFDDLLAKGFNTRQTDVRPAGSVNTAFQLVAVIFQLQSLQQFGGVSATHLDWTMVPYVRKSFWKHYRDGLIYLEENNNSEIFTMKDSDTERSIENEFWRANTKVYRYAMDMTQKEVHQAVEGFYHNLNTLQSRSGNQLPFTSANYGTCTLPEGRMVTKALLEVSIEGLGRLHRTSIFPCGIFQCMKGVNREPGDPNYDLFKLALKSTAQRLYPNYANVDWSGNAGYDRSDPRTYFSTMGCRTVNGADINGLGLLKDGRGNLCPVTIILPTIAMECKVDFEKDVESGHSFNNNQILIDRFMSRLDEAIHDAKDMLIERYEWICSQSPDSAKFMYENGLMAGYVPEEGIRSALKHGTLTIGQLALAEALQILIGDDQTSPQGMELAKKIEQLFKTRCAEFKQEYKLNFGVYYTPKIFGLGVAQVIA